MRVNGSHFHNNQNYVSALYDNQVYKPATHIYAQV